MYRYLFLVKYAYTQSALSWQIIIPLVKNKIFHKLQKAVSANFAVQAK